MNRIYAAILLILTLILPTSVLATDGAFEINQACVADGCFPGDDAGFPVVLANHGNYVLTSNLTVNNLTDTAILVLASNINIDLKGFGIYGSNFCTGFQEDCTSTIHDGYGIRSIDAHNVRVRSGIIRGMGWIGIDLGHFATVEDMVVEHNLWAGISVEAGSTIRNSKANFSGFTGMEAGESNLVDCSVAYNGKTGFKVNRSILTRVTAVKSGTWAGLEDQYGSQIHDSAFRENEIGIWSKNGATSIFNSTIISNNNQGVIAFGGNEPNPEGVAMPVILSGNTIVLNNGGNANQQLGMGGGGNFVELATNYCGSNTTCP